MTNILEESLLLSDYTFGFELEAIIKNNSSFYNDVINENLNKNDLNFKERLNENNQNEIIIGYHGTNNNFDEFDSKYRRISTFGQGFYFVNSEDEANEYGDIIIKAALTMKNPLIIKDVFIGNEDVLEPIGIKKMSHLNSDDSLEKIKKAGYDSIIVLNAEGKRNLKYYIVFDNSQIRIISKLSNINESFVMDYNSEKPIIYYTHSDSEAKRMINTLLSKNPIRGLYDFVNKVYLLGDAYEVIHYDLIDKTNRYGNTKFKYPTDDREIYQYLDKKCAMFKIIDENDYKSFSKSDGYKYAYIGKLDNNQYIICRNNELAPSHYNAPDELKKIQQVPLFQNIKFVNYDVRERITKDTMPQKLVDESIHYAKQFKNNYGENSLFTIEKNPTKQEFWSLLKNSIFKESRGICGLEPYSNLYIWDAYFGTHQEIYNKYIKGHDNNLDKDFACLFFDEKDMSVFGFTKDADRIKQIYYDSDNKKQKDTKWLNKIIADDDLGLLKEDNTETFENNDNPKLNDAFWKWFGNSKVVDKNGQPLVVYHGTTKSFNSFDKNRVGERKGTVRGKGFYFTDSLSRAERWGGSLFSGKTKNTRVMDVYLNIRNPYIGQSRYIPDGYDGRIIKEDDGTTTYVVLEPNQIKSVKNVGRWDPNSNNMFENNIKNLNNILLNEKSYSEKELQTINHNKERYGLSLYGSFEEQLYEAYLITNRKYAEDIREEYLNNIEEYISDHTNIDVYEESENLGITEEEWYAEYAEKYVPNVDTILDDEWHNEPDLNKANKLLNNARLKYIDDVYNFINKLCKENNYELNKVESRQSDSTYFEIYQIKTNADGYEETINEYKIRISDHKSPQSSRKYGYNDLDYSFGTNINDIIKDIQKLMQGNVLKESEDIGIISVHDKIKKKLDDILNEGINDKLPNNSHITIDMSVKPNNQEKEYNKQDISFEYNSPVIPCKPIWFAKVIKFLSDIKKQGIYTNSSCGFHHHLSFNLQNERDIIWIYCNMASDPEFFEEITKLDNTYNLTDDKYAELGTMVQLGEDILNKDYDKILEKLTTDKYRLFRIHPQGTLEWRGPRGFLNNATIDIIKDFYKLFIKLITKTKSYLDSDILIGTNINKEEFFNELLLAKKRTNNNIKLEFLSLPNDDEYKEGNIKFKSNEKYNKQSIEKIVNKIKQNPNILYNIILNQPKIIIDIYNVIGKMNFIQLVLNIKNDNIFNQMNVRKKEKITNTIKNVLLLNNININEIESIFSRNLLNLNNNEYELEEKINQLIKNNTINETNLYNIIMQSIYDQRKLYLNKLLKLLFSNNLLEKFNEEKLLNILLKICGNSKIINKIWEFEPDFEIIDLKIMIKRYNFEDNWDSIIYKALNGNHAKLIKLLVKYNIPILRYLISFNPEYYKYLPKRVQEQIIKE